MKLHRPPLGVAGGFVLEGFGDGRRFLAHYDFPPRACTLHEIDNRQRQVMWFYYRDLHSVVAVEADGERVAGAIDLGEAGHKAATSSRAIRAIDRARAGIWPYPLKVSPLWMTLTDLGIYPPSYHTARLDSRSGILYYGQATGRERSLTPLVDGSPVLKGSRIVQALDGGDVVAILAVGDRELVLYFISVSRGNVLGMFHFPTRPEGSTFALSRNGEHFAWAVDSHRLEVCRCPGRSAPLSGDSPRRFMGPFRNAGAVVPARS